MTHRPDSVEEMKQGVEELTKQWKHDFAEIATGLPYGARNMTDAQHVMWFEEMMRRYPPEMWTSPEGQQVMESPWLLALRYTEDGEKEAKRYIRTKMREAMHDVPNR